MRVDTIGLFSRNKNKPEWRQGLIPTTLELNNDHMKLITQTVTDTIFYRDIMNIEVVTNIVNIKTNVKTYSLMSSKLRGGSDKANELYNQLLVRMSENKKWVLHDVTL